MKKEELIRRVSFQSQVNEDVCTEVINAFEEVLTEEISESGSLSNAFDRVFHLMNFFKNKKRTKHQD